jgi:hypothetical protein
MADTHKRNHEQQLALPNPPRKKGAAWEVVQVEPYEETVAEVDVVVEGT